MGKISWSDIFADFKRVYPRLSKTAIHWCPYGYLIIRVWFIEGLIMVYDYSTHSGTFVSNPGTNEVIKISDEEWEAIQEKLKESDK